MGLVGKLQNGGELFAGSEPAGAEGYLLAVLVGSNGAGIDQIGAGVAIAVVAVELQNAGQTFVENGPDPKVGAVGEDLGGDDGHGSFRTGSADGSDGHRVAVLIVGAVLIHVVAIKVGEQGIAGFQLGTPVKGVVAGAGIGSGT